MKHFIINRVVKTNPKATYGVLINDENNTPFALTLELPWENNQKDISCIPLGFYNCQRVTTPKHGEVFQILDVPNRIAILFHKGNTVDDIKGCIAIGEMFDPVNGENGITFSGKGYNEFMELLKDEDRFTLQIV